MEKNKADCMPKIEFSRLLKETIQSVDSSENVIVGLKACGIIPLNPRTVLHNQIPKGPSNEAILCSNNAHSNSV